MIPEELKARAASRSRGSRCGIGAAYLRNLTEPDRDGLRVSVLVTDTVHGFETVEVLIPRASEIDSRRVEDEVERRAGGFAIETRMRDLVMASPFVLDVLAQ